MPFEAMMEVEHETAYGTVLMSALHKRHYFTCSGIFIFHAKSCFFLSLFDFSRILFACWEES